MCCGELNLDHVDQMIPFLDRERFAFKSITGLPPSNMSPYVILYTWVKRDSVQWSFLSKETTGCRDCSVRSRRDRLHAQSFGLVEEEKLRGEWGGDALEFSRAFSAHFSRREWRLHRQNYERKYNSASYAGYRDWSSNYQPSDLKSNMLTTTSPRPHK